jgi:hypothetical protein
MKVLVEMIHQRMNFDFMRQFRRPKDGGNVKRSSFFLEVWLLPAEQRGLHRMTFGGILCNTKTHGCRNS